WNSRECDRANTCLAGRPELWTVPIETVCGDIAEREDARRVHRVHHGRCKLGLRLKAAFFGHCTLRAACRRRLGTPQLRQEEPLIHQGIALPRGISRKHPHLAILYLAQGATVLTRHTHRVLPFFWKACFIQNEDAIGLPHVGSDQTMVYLEHLGLIPRNVTDPPLHRSHATGTTLHDDRFDAFEFEDAKLPHHIPKKMVAPLARPSASLA